MGMIAKYIARPLGIFELMSAFILSIFTVFCLSSSVS